MMNLRPVVEALLTISPWPWKAPLEFLNQQVVGGNKIMVADAAIFHEKVTDEICTANGNFIASSPLWLAQVIVGWIESEVQHQGGYWNKDHRHQQHEIVLSRFNLTFDLWQRLKARIEEVK